MIGLLAFWLFVFGESMFGSILPPGINRPKFEQDPPKDGLINLARREVILNGNKAIYRWQFDRGLVQQYQVKVPFFKILAHGDGYLLVSNQKVRYFGDFNRQAREIYLPAGATRILHASSKIFLTDVGFYHLSDQGHWESLAKGGDFSFSLGAYSERAFYWVSKDGELKRHLDGKVDAIYRDSKITGLGLFQTNPIVASRKRVLIFKQSGELVQALPVVAGDLLGAIFSDAFHVFAVSGQNIQVMRLGDETIHRVAESVGIRMLDLKANFLLSLDEGMPRLDIL